MPRNRLIQLRRGSSAQWISSNPVLANGESGFETDTGRLKIGDGISDWLELDYIGSKENISRVRNLSGSAIYKAQSVYFDSYSSLDSIPTIQKFVANGSNKQKFCGLLDNNIMNGSYGIVVHNGIISGLDTTGNVTTNYSVAGENWSNGDILYVHPSQSGKLTKIKPQHSIIVGLVLYVDFFNGALLIKPFINPAFSSLSDVILGNLSEDDLIKYDTNATSWKNNNSLDGGLI
jgi:hypothetical protein